MRGQPIFRSSRSSDFPSHHPLIACRTENPSLPLEHLGQSTRGKGSVRIDSLGPSTRVRLSIRPSTNHMHGHPACSSHTSCVTDVHELAMADKDNQRSSLGRREAERRPPDGTRTYQSVPWTGPIAYASKWDLRAILLRSKGRDWTKAIVTTKK